MARYNRLFSVPTSPPNLKQTITRIVESCNLDLVYETRDYLVAQERPGHVSYSRLAKVEFLISLPMSQEAQTRINLVVRNEELPLRLNNHCQQVFESVNRAIVESEGWQAA
jgi:hypothetical protein